MKVLISSIGTTDPIKDNHDAALLHLVRHKQPEKIILIYSEEMLEKHEIIVTSIMSVLDNKPEIILEPEILEDVYVFDKVFEQLSKIIKRYLNDEDDFILNLSSGTPQIISAMFAFNRISNVNCEAYQVTTPKKSANAGSGIERFDDLDLILRTNKDNLETTESRLLRDESEKFNAALVRSHLRMLIDNYDYNAAYNILNDKSAFNIISKRNRAKLIIKLENILNAIKKQKILSDIDVLHYSTNMKRALNSLLLIILAFKKANVVEVLIKAKTLAEFMLEDFIETEFTHVIYWEKNFPKLNPEHKDFATIVAFIQEEMKSKLSERYDETKIFRTDFTLNLLSYENILAYYDVDVLLLEQINVILKINDERNKVAHGLHDIKLTSKTMFKVIEALKEIFKIVYHFDHNEWFNYYDEQNKVLAELLK